MEMQQDLIKVDGITLEKIATRDRQTNEETTAWKIDHPEMKRPVRGDTPQEALEVFGECIAKDDDERTAVDLEDLAE
jgi:Cu/Ag efflux pump CusA